MGWGRGGGGALRTGKLESRHPTCNGLLSPGKSIGHCQRIHESLFLSWPLFTWSLATRESQTGPSLPLGCWWHLLHTWGSLQFPDSFHRDMRLHLCTSRARCHLDPQTWIPCLFPSLCLTLSQILRPRHFPQDRQVVFHDFPMLLA